MHKLSLPKALGGNEEKGTTNPETLFAGGYSACFLTAMAVAAQRQKKSLPKDARITSEHSPIYSLRALQSSVRDQKLACLMDMRSYAH